MSKVESNIVPASSTSLSVDFCIIGAGSGGLSVAAAAAAFGQRVVLIEKHKMGGDCLNYGCVPSKALLSAGKRAHAIQTSAPFGITSQQPVIDYRAVHKHVHEVIGAIAPNDSVERFTGLGVQVITAAARFVDEKTVAAGDFRVTARWFVIATGSSPSAPPISGLSDVPYFTNETIFDNAQLLPHLVVIGGGPIGLEMAQAHRRLGSKVTVIEAAKALGRDDPEMAIIVLQRLRAEGVEIIEDAKVTSVARTAAGISATTLREGATRVIDATHLLVAAGRRPNISELGLEAAGISVDKKGITVNPGLVTSNRRVFAIGDVAGGPQFTHIANDDAGIVIRRALFRLPAKTTGRAVPWVTFTEPELANAGLSEADARTKFGKINVLRWPYHENDRAQAERETIGHVKVITDKGGRILGASIVGAHAGELIQMWSLALSQRLKIKAMTSWISPYPTLSEINKRAAFRYYATAAGNPFVRKIIALLTKLG